MNKRKKILVVDVETANGLNNPLVYDIGFIITDKEGTVYEKRSYCIKEIFGNLKLMSSSYYSNKFQNYIELLVNSEMKYVNFAHVIDEMNSLVSKYKVKTVAAYNLFFDDRAIQGTMKKLGLEGSWIDESLEKLCLWSFACEVLYNKNFIEMALANQWVTERGNIKTSAEMGYRFIKRDPSFIEAHQGIDDVLIEKEIMVKCFKTKKKHESGMLWMPWQIVKKKAQNLNLLVDNA